MGSGKDVVIVAAGVAYRLYRAYGLYFCQIGRTFRDVQRIGFYTGNEIKPELPLILAHRDRVVFDRASVTELRGPHDPMERALAEAIDRMLDDKAVEHGQSEQVFLLSAHDDPRTEVLRAPIRNVSCGPSGRRAAWTQGQRYASLAALRTNPETTADLLIAEGQAS